MTPFREYFTEQYSKMAAKYRDELSWVAETVRSHCTDTKLSREQANGMIDILQRIPVPPKHPAKWEGETTDADREWFKWYYEFARPSSAAILQDAIKEINELSL